MLDPSSTTLESLADAMQTYSPELSNKLFKLYEKQYQAEHTPQETMISYWEKKLGNFWGDLHEQLGGFFDGIKNFFTDLFGKIFNTESGTFHDDYGLGNTIITRMEQFMNLVSKGLGIEIGEVGDDLLEPAKSFWQKILDFLNDIWAFIVKLLGGDPTSGVVNILDLMERSNVFKGLQHLFQTLGGIITDLIDKLRNIAEFKNWNWDVGPTIDTYATGGRIGYNQTALVGEAGAELIQHAGGGATLASGPSMANLKKGDIVYNAKQTKQILDGKSLDFGRFAEGTVDDFMFRGLPALGIAGMPVSIPI